MRGKPQIRENGSTLADSSRHVNFHPRLASTEYAYSTLPTDGAFTNDVSSKDCEVVLCSGLDWML